MKTNILSLPGISNARELGGYPADGKYIRRNVLIRSGDLSRALPEAVRILQEQYHVRTVIDFRMREKREHDPDVDIPFAANIGLPVVEMEDYIAMSGLGPEAFQQASGKKEGWQELIETAIEKGMLGPDMYLLFLLSERGKNAYRGFFRSLLEADPAKGALLWHCESGKDRAGLASMLLLSALGANRETILKDYLLTNECHAHLIEAARKKYEAAGMPEEKLNTMLFLAGGVFENYMHHSIDTLEHTYGSVTGYLQQELGLSEPDILLLREMYLTS